MVANKRGRNPAPTALRVLHGERADRINYQEPRPESGLPRCPDNAPYEVHEIWRYTVEHLDKMGCVSLADRDMIYAYCEAVVLHRHASSLIAHKRELLDIEMARSDGELGTEERLTASLGQAVRMQKTAAESMRNFGSQFGLSPSSRGGIKVGDKPGDANSAERFLSA
jgi:P27 family predicted phage terminase small subunit